MSKLILSDSNLEIISKSIIILFILSAPLRALCKNLLFIVGSSNPPSRSVKIYP